MSKNAILIFAWIKASYSESFDFNICVSTALVYLGHICICTLFAYVANSSNCKHKIEGEKMHALLVVEIFCELYILTH